MRSTVWLSIALSGLLSAACFAQTGADPFQSAPGPAPAARSVPHPPRPAREAEPAQPEPVVAPHVAPGVPTPSPGGRVWDLRSALSQMRNPSGVWTWGFGNGQPGTMRLAVSFERDGLAGWGSPNSPFGDHNPSILYNTSAHILELAGTLPFQPGEFGLHPGPVENLLLRFTSPTRGKFDISATFWMKHSNGVLVKIIKNAKVIAEGTTKPVPFSFAEAVPLEKDDNIDFVLSAGQFGYNSNTTSASILLRARS